MKDYTPKYFVKLYSKRTNKLVEIKGFCTETMLNIYINAREKEGFWYWTIH